jgi:hypothetical protein
MNLILTERPIKLSAEAFGNTIPAGLRSVHGELITRVEIRIVDLLAGIN